MLLPPYQGTINKKQNNKIVVHINHFLFGKTSPLNGMSNNSVRYVRFECLSFFEKICYCILNARLTLTTSQQPNNGGMCTSHTVNVLTFSLIKHVHYEITKTDK